MNSNSLDYLYDISVHIETVKLEVKTQCSIKLIWKKGGQSIQTKKDCRIDKSNLHQIDEKLTMRTSIQQDSITNSFIQKLTQIFVVLYVDDKTKLAGVCTLNVGEILQMSQIRQNGRPLILNPLLPLNINEKLVIPLTQCPDSDGSINLTITSIYIKQINQDELSNFSLSSTKIPNNKRNSSRLDIDFRQTQILQNLVMNSQSPGRRNNIQDCQSISQQECKKCATTMQIWEKQVNALNDDLFRKNSDIQLKQELFENTLQELTKFKSLYAQQTHSQCAINSKQLDSQKIIQELKLENQKLKNDNISLTDQMMNTSQIVSNTQKKTTEVNNFNRKIIEMMEQEINGLKAKSQAQQSIQENNRLYEIMIENNEKSDYNHKQKSLEDNTQILDLKLQIKNLLYNQRDNAEIILQKNQTPQVKILNEEFQQAQESNLQEIKDLKIQMKILQSCSNNQAQDQFTLEESLKKNEINYRDQTQKLQTNNRELRLKSKNLEENVIGLNLKIIKELDHLMMKQNQMKQNQMKHNQMQQINCFNCNKPSDKFLDQL